MNIKERLFMLSSVDAAGSVTDASDLAFEMLSKHCKTQKADNLTVLGFLKGESDYTIMLDAHIDQISMVVTDIDDNGFLTVEKAGGIDIRALPSRRVVVYGKEKITAVFCSTPPHLSKGNTEYTDISKIKLDTCLGERAREIISVGDMACFDTKPEELCDGTVSGKSFDNRAAVTVLIEAAKRLKNKKLPISVAFVLSDGEELGLRGIRTTAFKVNPDEALVIDVSFAEGPNKSAGLCGKLGKGAMIGISPILDGKISKKLTQIAQVTETPYQNEVMGKSTGTNADMVSVTREGVRTGVLSIPLRNMHTDVEILNLNDLENTVRLICEYVLSGGVMDA